jgi:hypothetical protein
VKCGEDRKQCIGFIFVGLVFILFCLLFHFLFTGPDSRFGDRHFKVPKTRFKGTLPGAELTEATFASTMMRLQLACQTFQHVAF